MYGEKIQIEVKGINVPVGTPVKIKLVAETNNGHQEFDGIEAFEWTVSFKNNSSVQSPQFKIRLPWFDEAIEEYNYRENINRPLEEESKAFKTTFVVEKLNRFSIEVTYGTEQKLRTKDEHILIPTSYRRNYEELIGLFKKDDSAGSKTTKENYENYFISLNPELEKTVNEFVKFVEKLPVVYQEDPEAANQLNIIKERVEKDAKSLWVKAAEPFKREKFDDRPLYWARLKMQSQLKRLVVFKPDIDLNKSQIKKGSKLDRIITIFEENSRNYTGINFTGTRPGTKKVLITGFDPFILNPQKEGNVLQANPSGCVALYFAANNVPNCDIQMIIVPVRYADFDNSERKQGEE